MLSTISDYLITGGTDIVPTTNTKRYNYNTTSILKILMFNYSFIVVVNNSRISLYILRKFNPFSVVL
jgi:hypothetical protein